MTIQSEYSRLISLLSTVEEPIRSELIKSVSATKTALEALDNAVLNDAVLTAIASFERVMVATNDLIEEMLTFTPAPAPCSFPFYQLSDNAPTDGETEPKATE